MFISQPNKTVIEIYILIYDHFTVHVSEEFCRLQFLNTHESY
jgi:hypothetical protein